MSDKSSPSLKHTMVIKCWKLLAVWPRINHSLLELLRGKNQGRVCILYKHLQLGSLQVCYLGSDGHRGFSLFFPPAVVVSTTIYYKEKILARISGFFLCWQLVSSDLAEIFSPAPGVSVLAQILAIGITV